MCHAGVMISNTISIRTKIQLTVAILGVLQGEDQRTASFNGNLQFYSHIKHFLKKLFAAGKDQLIKDQFSITATRQGHTRAISGLKKSCFEVIKIPGISS